jgi:hypothetical protein
MSTTVASVYIRPKEVVGWQEKKRLRRQKNSWRSHQTLVSHMSVAFVGQPQKGRTTAQRILPRAPVRLALRNQGKLVAKVAEGLIAWCFDLLAVIAWVFSDVVVL